MASSDPSAVFEFKGVPIDYVCAICFQEISEVLDAQGEEGLEEGARDVAGC